MSATEPAIVATERAVVGALLLEPTRIPEVSEVLRAEHFFERPHAVLFDCLLDMRERGVAIDFLTVADALRVQAKLVAVGGADFLDLAARSVTTTANVVRHARMVADAAALRRAQAIAARIQGARSIADVEPLALELTATSERRASEVRPLPTVCLADVQAREVEWLWPGMIPVGKLTVLVGPPGVGKSSVARDLAARVTLGSTAPGNTGLEVGRVLYVAGEEDPGDTLRPALDAAGANARLVHVIRDPPAMPGEASRLRAALVLLNADGPPVRLVIIDTVADVLGRTDDCSNADVRRALQPLRQLAEEFGIAVVLVAHTRKAGGTTMAGRVMGSTAFSALARSVIAVVRDPEAADSRLVALVKSNLAALDGAAWTVRLWGKPLRVEWTGQRQVAEAELLATLEPPPALRPRDEATEWLRETLSGGPLEASEIARMAEDAGIAKRTLRRASERLAVERGKAGMGGGWIWSLRAAGGIAEHGQPEHVEESGHLHAGTTVAATEAIQAADAGSASNAPPKVANVDAVANVATFGEHASREAEHLAKLPSPLHAKYRARVAERLEVGLPRFEAERVTLRELLENGRRGCVAESWS